MEHLTVFSDIHANLPAMKAILRDMDKRGERNRYCLGDLVGYGTFPNEVIELIRESGLPTIMGNYDQGIGESSDECGCAYNDELSKALGKRSVAWTNQHTNDENKAFLRSLAGSIPLQLGELKVLLVHGSPRKINEYLLPDRTDVQLVKLADQAEADVVCVGHVHIPYHRMMTASDGRTVHYVSSGSVGKPKDGDPRAAWVELVLGSASEVIAATGGDTAAKAGAGDVWAGTIVHRVCYDIERVSAAMAATGLPETLAEALRRA